MADKLDLVFKKTVNREYTNNAKQWYEEQPSVPYKLKGSDIWTDNIPSTPPDTDTTTVKCYVSTKLTLTKDTTVNNNKAWLAKDESSNRIGGFISPRYGSGYAARLFDNNNTEVMTTNAVGWFFDYEAGIITFDNDPVASGFTAPFKLHAYRYIGSTVDDVASVYGDYYITGDKEFTGDVTIDGDLLVKGTTTTIHSEEMTVTDNVIVLNQGEIGEGVSKGTAGIIVDRGVGPDSSSVSFLFDETDDLWKLSFPDTTQSEVSIERPVTNIIYVDGAREDNYVPNGSDHKPFLTGADAIAIANSGDLIVFAPGTYSDNMTFPDGVSARGSGRNNVKFSGDIVTGVNEMSFQDIIFNGELEINTTSICELINCASHNTVTFNGNAVGNNFSVTDLTSGKTAVVLNSGNVTLNTGQLASTGDVPTVSQLGGTLNLSSTQVTGSRTTDPVLVSTAGQVSINESGIINLGGGKAADIANGANVNSPNALNMVYHVGGIDCGDAATIVEGVYYTDPVGTNLIRRPATQIANTSTIIDTTSYPTVSDAIDVLAGMTKYDNLLEAIIVDPLITLTT